ncbi:EUKARYOTIC TRANSLATION INITIATION FACTOR 4B/4H [Salix viminalis]|uniref:EUKARYOTIC TRANSLATION INITIATION FACTOR 4B/4H n=1 Tax=Salix viminalis TaxID=40686 RepID=A0A9Q0UW88_SALVM|nr:EUKARYOTIC TRANSLATION INITIATION FACTOR 4B/4H [Salix viminalis]
MLLVGQGTNTDVTLECHVKNMGKETTCIRRVFNTDPVAQLLDIGKLSQQSWTIVAMLVDYACTPEEVQQHFQSCGTVNRVTILTDKFGQPKGFAYVEFLEVEAVQEALVLNESELHGRQLKVSPKRTNVPGMKQYRPSRFNPYMGYRFRRPYVPPYFYSPYGYGKVPRFRRSMRYMPYY